jgi:hypothetical protein
MSRARFLVVSLAALITVALVVVGGLAIYRIGWSEGFKASQLMGRTAEQVLPPSSFGYPGLLLTLAVIFVLLIVVGRFLRFSAWRHGAAWGPWMMAGGPWRAQGEGWARHPGPRPFGQEAWAGWHRRHGPMPPWCWGWEEPSGHEDEEAKPASRNAEPKAQSGAV